MLPAVCAEHSEELPFQTPLYVPFRLEDDPTRFIVTLSVIVLASRVAVPIAPLPSPPENVTAGPKIYPDPGSVMTTEAT